VKAVDEERLVEKRGNLKADTMHKIDVGLKTAMSL
jgi:mRNA-degrading endonuclease toxin of MazEF toxin-antitoxin module